MDVVATRGICVSQTHLVWTFKYKFSWKCASLQKIKSVLTD